MSVMPKLPTVPSTADAPSLKLALRCSPLVGCRSRPRLARRRLRSRGETTDSGVRIRTVEPGAGPFIQPMDGVLIEYEGRLADGTVFDDSAGHGGPQPMIAGQVIPGFAEALHARCRRAAATRSTFPASSPTATNPPAGQPDSAQCRPRFRRAHRPGRAECGADGQRGEVPSGGASPSRRPSRNRRRAALTGYGSTTSRLACLFA